MLASFKAGQKLAMSAFKADSKPFEWKTSCPHLLLHRWPSHHFVFQTASDVWQATGLDSCQIGVRIRKWPVWWLQIWVQKKHKIGANCLQACPRIVVLLAS
ncbi:unnamed protein product [Protopolystoma xenopodis]|uniref:Uncharacterized protein n=1 Tax=Protopolystoma xenopodis TaxID=117903 RepID=A0A448WJT3_9PLAT|nr:unnamed protein product [Protopolystoma xenopodis]